MYHDILLRYSNIETLLYALVYIKNESEYWKYFISIIQDNKNVKRIAAAVHLKMLYSREYYIIVFLLCTL